MCDVKEGGREGEREADCVRRLVLANSLAIQVCVICMSEGVLFLCKGVYTLIYVCDTCACVCVCVLVCVQSRILLHYKFNITF